MKYTHDLHVHTIYSSDTSKKATVENYLEKAKELGLTKMGFAEHFWDDRVEGAFPFYRTQTFEFVSRVRPEIEQWKGQGVELLFGCEVEYDPAHKAPALTPEVAERFDFVIVPNSHSHETMPKAYYDDKEKHKDFILEAFYNILSCDVSRYVTAIAHPFSLVRCPYPCDDLIGLVSDDEFKRLFAQTAEKNIAIELNLGSFLGGLGQLGLEPAQMDRCQLMRMFRLAKAEGCKFIFGSDAHAPSHLACFADADLLVQTLELQDADIAPIALGR